MALFGEIPHAAKHLLMELPESASKDIVKTQVALLKCAKLPTTSHKRQLAEYAAFTAATALYSNEEFKTIMKEEHSRAKKAKRDEEKKQAIQTKKQIRAMRAEEKKKEITRLQADPSQALLQFLRSDWVVKDKEFGVHVRGLEDAFDTWSEEVFGTYIISTSAIFESVLKEISSRDDNVRYDESDRTVWGVHLTKIFELKMTIRKAEYEIAREKQKNLLPMFLQSYSVLVGGGNSMPLERFKNAFLLFCDKKREDRPQFTPDYYGDVFQSANITISAEKISGYWRGKLETDFWIQGVTLEEADL